MRRPAAKRTSPAERLARALRGEKPAGLTCADVQIRLPQLVDAALRGENIAHADPDVAQHLLVCETCSALHALMLDAELALAPAPAPLPFPGVTTILGPSTAEEIQAWIMARARELLDAVRGLTDPTELERAARTFFGLLRRLGGDIELQPAAVYALGHGGELAPAARYLAAVYLATQWLAQDPTQERSAAQRTTAARGFALRAAEDLGLPGPSAVQFANEFARLVTAPGVRLPVWPAKP
jgi:hypothetical protein